MSLSPTPTNHPSPKPPSPIPARIRSVCNLPKDFNESSTIPTINKGARQAPAIAETLTKGVGKGAATDKGPTQAKVIIEASNTTPAPAKATTPPATVTVPATVPAQAQAQAQRGAEHREKRLPITIKIKEARSHSTLKQ
jgi:hypothetical protein